MTQEEKQVKMVDLCARLPYGVIAGVPHYDEEDGSEVLLQGKITGIVGNQVRFEYLPDCTDDEGAYNWFDIEDAKPYLKPMSSMTEADIYVMASVLTQGLPKDIDVENGCCKLTFKDILVDMDFDFSVQDVVDGTYGVKGYDWLNEYMFDFRGLIDMGQAIAISGDKPDLYDVDRHITDKKFADKLKELLDLEDNWDKRGSKKIGEKAIHNLRLIWFEFNGKWDFETWSIFPGVNGDIIVMHKDDDIDVEIIINPDDTYTWFGNRGISLKALTYRTFYSDEVASLMKEVEQKITKKDENRD